MISLSYLLYIFTYVYGYTYSQSDKPVVTAVTEKLAVDINSTATLSCHAHALPAPRFEWYRGNQHITGDARTSLVSATPQPGGADVYEGQLSLRDVTASDLGKYRCVARNEIGNGMAQIQLTVKSKICIITYHTHNYND